MPKLTLTAATIPVAPVYPQVADLVQGLGGGMRRAGGVDTGANGYIVILENFSAVAAEALDSRFDVALGRIFSTALNRFSITLS